MVVQSKPRTVLRRLRRTTDLPLWRGVVSCTLALFAVSTSVRFAFADADGAAPPKTAPGSTHADRDSAYLRLRGLEQQPDEGSTGLAVARVLFFVPRVVLDGLTYSMAYGAYVQAETSIPRRINEFLTFDQRRLGVHPLISVSSGSRAEFGAEIAYRVPRFGASISGLYGNHSNRGAAFDFVTDFGAGSIPLKARLRAFVNERDDYEFYGYGPTPAEDPRNELLLQSGSEYVVYAQRLARSSISMTGRVWRNLQLFYAGFYQERKLGDFHDPNGAGGSVDPSAPSIVKQIYQEVGFRVDTRKFEQKISPGARLEAYAGFSNAVGGDKGRFRRLGVDATLFVPVLQRNRLLVPRFVLDTVDDLDESQPLSFADYPRQPWFRGASSTQLLRTDLFSVVPSVEYQWPLTHNVAGHLFVDYLMVADALERLSFRNAPYAYGAGISIDGARSEIGRLAVSSGSQGVRLMISVGLTSHLSDPIHWM